MTEKGHHILLIDDDEEVLHLNGEFFRKKGFSVYLACSVNQALELLKKQIVHCMVLDVMMPEVDGFTAFDLLRKESEAPIIFLTGRSSQEDRIKGLMLGADDYLTKPCSLEELYLRIMINLRKAEKITQTETHKENVLEFPPLMIELLEHKVFCGREEIFLTNREYALLVLLAKAPGKEFSFGEIAKELYEQPLEGDRKNIMVTASRLRKKLEQHVGLEHVLETVWGKGYRFVPR